MHDLFIKLKRVSPSIVVFSLFSFAEPIQWLSGIAICSLSWLGKLRIVNSSPDIKALQSETISDFFSSFSRIYW